MTNETATLPEAPGKRQTPRRRMLMTGLVAGLYFIDVIIITPPSAFSISWSSYIVFVAVAGGMGTVAGPIVGAVLFILIERLLGAAAGQGLLALGVLSILLMLLLPRGVMGLVADLTRARDEAEAAPDTADPVNVSQLKRSNP